MCRARPAAAGAPSGPVRPGAPELALPRMDPRGAGAVPAAGSARPIILQIANTKSGAILTNVYTTVLYSYHMFILMYVVSTYRFTSFEDKKSKIHLICICSNLPYKTRMHKKLCLAAAAPLA